MLRPKAMFQLDTERLILRPPRRSDYRQWAALMQENETFLTPWKPAYNDTSLSRYTFSQRVLWADNSIRAQSAYPLLLTTKQDKKQLLGAITLDTIRRGPVQSANLGYWIGEPYTCQGFMQEAVQAIVDFSFNQLDLSRIEAACLPKNLPSRRVLEKSGFKYEGVAQSYLQIDGRWRNHVLYAILRNDRRGVAKIKE